MNNSILIVDDDEVLRNRLSRAFANRGLAVFVAKDAEEAIEVVQNNEIERAVLDLKMPGRSGMDLLSELKEVSPRTDVVILTGYGSISNAVESIKLGALNYVTKPADADHVLNAFETSNSENKSTDFDSPSLAEAEWNLIQQTLVDCSGNVSEAARKLGIPRRTLQRKLKKMAP